MSRPRFLFVVRPVLDDRLYPWVLVDTVAQNKLVFRSELYMVSRFQLTISHMVFFPFA
ncbi:hypothetical protein P4H57_15095 [Paenibacillus pabuli]|nr:hypothetical protein [Paenibacillus pabuli]MEC0125907.1 hypothetical protein [Paenibacillus pabuli]